MDDIQRRAMYETHERCCENCNHRYFEACIGITMVFGRVDGCKKALEVYTERFNKWLTRSNK